ncbi:hypothetical protein chiPu_0000178 [Chiloscyllium punctatum]|uniref:Uncharacterized protein n=1 Tax=Chiloscyllium punctatum TaxID=137246 RepID=A0A401RS99_CHIPU|nr:hypothetical protein [Chiloscyllium punctatum]
MRRSGPISAGVKGHQLVSGIHAFPSTFKASLRSKRICNGWINCLREDADKNGAKNKKKSRRQIFSGAITGKRCHSW